MLAQVAFAIVDNIDLFWKENQQYPKIREKMTLVDFFIFNRAAFHSISVEEWNTKFSSD